MHSASEEAKGSNGDDKRNATVITSSAPPPSVEINTHKKALLQCDVIPDSRDKFFLQGDFIKHSITPGPAGTKNRKPIVCIGIGATVLKSPRARERPFGLMSSLCSL